MKKTIEIKGAAKYFKVSEQTFNKFLNDCKFNIRSKVININKLNEMIVKKSLKNLNKGKQK